MLGCLEGLFARRSEIAPRRLSGLSGFGLEVVDYVDVEHDEAQDTRRDSGEQ